MTRPGHRLLTAALTGLLLVLLASCDRGPRIYAAHGVVQDVNRQYGQLVIAHEDIPGLMPAMTMSFDVADPNLLTRLEAGQAIDFQLAFDGRSYRVLSATVREAGVDTSAGSPKISDAAAERDPAFPFQLTDQDGNPLSLGDLRGKALLLDFIYTNCPGPCPILTGLHVTVQRQLDRALRPRVHFVSISLDPVSDTPTALREYAAKHGADLSGWSFLTGPPDEVDRVVRAYGIGSARQSDGTIAHLVATFLIDGQGRIVHRYIGLDEDPKLVREDLEAVARSLLAMGGEGERHESATERPGPAPDGE